jgi:hypothetical protein
MNHLSNVLEEYSYFIITACTVLSLLSLTIVIINSLKTRKIIRKYKRLMRGMDNKNLESMLTHQLERIQNVVNRIENLEQRHQSVVHELESCIQKVGVMRYNPFEQMGSDLSFSIALLDKMGNGVVLTGLFTRSTSTVYAKPVTKGSSSYPLSQEEIEAINKALS